MPTDTNLDFNSPITNITGIGPRIAQKLARLEIKTVRDLLFHIPRRYLDLTRPVAICDLAAREIQAVEGTLDQVVTDIGAHYISVIDVEKNEVLDQVAVGETPHGISFSQDKTLAFVPLYDPGEVVIIDVVKRNIIKRIKVGDELHNSVIVQINEN